MYGAILLIFLAGCDTSILVSQPDDPSPPKPPLMAPTVVLGELRVHEVTESGATCDGDVVRMTI